MQAPEPHAGLAEKAARGFAWMMLQTVLGKAVNFGSEILLALWIIKADFGLRSDVFTVFMFANILQDAGINQVLIHRQATFKRWANAAFWASLGLGALVGAVLLCIAPLVAHFYRVPQLLWMIVILGIRSPIAALGTVSYARLQIELQYRKLAVIGFTTVCATSMSAVFCAYSGLGAFSFVWPLLVGSIVRSSLLWQTARPVVHLNLQIHRWRYLVTQSGLSLAATALFIVSTQGDYTVLGHIYNTQQGLAAVVGIYFFAFNLCIQTTQFITSNLANVLLPAFSKMQNEPQRLRNAFLKTTKLLALTGLLVCFLQAAIAEPMIRALFRANGDPDKWLPAVPVLQVISVAMALQLFNMPALALIQAQGRFKAMLALSVVCAVSFVSMVLVAAHAGIPPVGQIRWPQLARVLQSVLGASVNVSSVVAVAVMLYCAIIGPVCLWVAIRPIGGKLAQIWPIYVVPIVISGFSVVVGSWAGNPIEHTRSGSWIKLIVIPSVSVLVYLPLVRSSARDVWDELAVRIRSRINQGAAA